MTLRAWIGRLFSGITADESGHTAWRNRFVARLTLDPLPGRDGPSSLAVAGATVTPAIALGANVSCLRLCENDSPPATPAYADFHSPTADERTNDRPPSRPEAGAGSRDPELSIVPRAWASSGVSFGPFLTADLSELPTTAEDRPVTVAPGDGRPSRLLPGTAATAFAPEPPADLAAAPPALTRPPIAVSYSPDGEVPSPEPEIPPTQSSPTDPPVETPPTFMDEAEPVDGVLVEQSFADSATPPEAMGSAVADSVAPPEIAGRLPAPAADAPDAVVAPAPGAAGRPVGPDTAVFLITGTPPPGGRLEVRYTLSAHDAGGTVSVDGAVTLTGHSDSATVSPGPVLAGRHAEILTIVLRDQPGRPTDDTSATLVPAGAAVSDSALFEAYRVGRSAESFDALVARHGVAVTRLCERVVGNRADAEDVAQFVFLTLAKWQVRFPGTLTGWLRAVARNASLAFLRARSRRVRYEREAARPIAVEASDPAGLDESLDAALRQLPAEWGEAVRLRYVEGYSQQEAARIVGCPRGTLSRRAAHGIRALREMLRGRHAAEG